MKLNTSQEDYIKKSQFIKKKFFLTNFSTKNFAEKGSFTGYASIFDKIDSQNDLIKNGAFNSSISNKDPARIKLLWQHDYTKPIGKIISLTENSRGLVVVAKLLLDITNAREAYSLIKSGIVTGLSIGFSIKNFYFDQTANCRVIDDLDLWEISLVTFPANSEAQITETKNNQQCFFTVLQTLQRASEALSNLYQS